MTIQLHPFAGADFATLAGWFDTEEAAVLWGGPAVRHPVTDPQLAAMLAECAGDPPARRCWSAFADGVLVGHAQFAYDWQAGTARLARIAIAPAARGRGLARPMLRQMIDSAWADPAIVRIELNVYAQNSRAIGLYTALGFATEGVRRRSVRVGDALWDTVMMAMLRDEQA